QPPVTNAAGEVVRYGPEVISAFDALVTPLRSYGEKTYSAPFATHLYVKEMVPQEDGSTIFTYPPLNYGGMLLEEGESRGADLLQKSLRGASWGLLSAVVVALLGLVLGALAKRRS